MGKQGFPNASSTKVPTLDLLTSKGISEKCEVEKIDKPEFETVQKRLFRLGQTANSALAIFPPRQLRKSDGFARTRRHLPERIRFVISLVIFGRRPQPGIAK